MTLLHRQSTKERRKQESASRNLQPLNRRPQIYYAPDWRFHWHRFARSVDDGRHIGLASGHVHFNARLPDKGRAGLPI